MNDRAWRTLAGQALDELDAMPLTPTERLETRRGLEHALALPGGAAAPAVWEVLTSHPALVEWLHEHAGPDVRRPSGLTVADEEDPSRAPAPWPYREPLPDAPPGRVPTRGGGTGAVRPSGSDGDVERGQQQQQQQQQQVPTEWSQHQHAEPPPAPPEQPTRTVYPRLDAPESVLVGSTFRITVGVGERPSLQLNAPSFFLVPVASFDLTMTLLVHGFRIVDGDGPQRTVRSNLATPFPTVDVLLETVDDPTLTRARSIVVEFSIEGRVLGVASVPVDVHGPDEVPLPVRESPGAPQDWALDPEGDDADVTITIARGNDRVGGVFQWSVKTPWPIPVPDDPSTTDLGENPRDWADSRRRVAEERAGNPVALRDHFNGIFLEVGDLVPSEVWSTLRAVAQRVGHPTVLITSAEPYVLWELAAVPDPWDPDRPAVLGTQATVGRWTYRSQGEQASPVQSIDVRSLAVVVGHYAGRAELPEAEGEAEDLARDYGAPQVPAQRDPLKAAIQGSPDADVLHFAGHGRFTGVGGQDGIVLEDLTTFTPTDVRGLRSSRPHLVFLNACQVGSQAEELGLPSGLAPAFCLIGVQAVLAPLWKVDDKAARDFADRFYRALLAGRPPAEFLAEERTRVLRDNDSGLTSLAYLWFGHPRLVAHDRRAGTPGPVPLLRGGR